MTILPFPRQALPQEQSPAGTYGFVQDDEPAEIHVTAGLTKTYAVRVRGKIWWEFNEATAAYRIASAMMTLNSYGFLDCVSTPSEVVRRRLAASVEEIGGA